MSIQLEFELVIIIIHFRGKKIIKMVGLQVFKNIPNNNRKRAKKNQEVILKEK